MEYVMNSPALWQLEFVSNQRDPFEDLEGSLVGHKFSTRYIQWEMSCIKPYSFSDLKLVLWWNFGKFVNSSLCYFPCIFKNILTLCDIFYIGIFEILLDKGQISSHDDYG